ncbi:MAG TPA: hypothetical protein VGE21_07405 [Flavobacteriales bacterium]
MRPLRSLQFQILLGLLLLATACTKEEVLVPVQENTTEPDTRCSTDSTGSVNTTDPANGGISDDGDDLGDNEGPRKKKKP